MNTFSRSLRKLEIIQFFSDRKRYFPKKKKRKVEIIPFPPYRRTHSPGH